MINSIIFHFSLRSIWPETKSFRPIELGLIAIFYSTGSDRLVA